MFLWIDAPWQQKPFHNDLLGSYCQLIDDKHFEQARRSAAEQDELLAVIMRNAKRLQRLADDILDVTKLKVSR